VARKARRDHGAVMRRGRLILVLVLLCGAIGSYAGWPRKADLNRDNPDRSCPTSFFKATKKPRTMPELLSC
jgi:hypothetical protein